MRIILISFFFIFSFTVSSQQRYISSAIIAYSGGAYERALTDLNYAFKELNAFSDEQAAKAYFYRGASTLRLVSGGKATSLIGKYPYLDVYRDFDMATKLDEAVWRSRVQPESSTLYSHLFDEGVQLFAIAEEHTYGSEQARSYYSLTIDHLKAARSLQNNYDVNYRLGQGYHRIADNYVRAKADRFLANYTAAILSYEDALKYSPESIDCINALIEVARILQDQERIRKYRLMAASLTASSR